MNTNSQSNLITMLQLFYKQRLRMPTYSEIADLLGVSSKESAYRQVHKLIEQGLLAKDPQGKLLPLQDGSQRNIAAHNWYGTQPDLLPRGIPLLGFVEAGLPNETEQDDLDTISLDTWLLHNPASSYILRVKGDSMIDAGIHDGDHVVADTKRTAHIGNIVIARLDGGMTIKYLRKKDNTFYLEAANEQFADMYPREGLEVQAVVTSIIRKLL